MIDQMKIGVSINVTGDATPKLKSFHSLVQKITKSQEALETRLKGLGIELSRFSEKLNSINPKLKAFYEQSNEAGMQVRGLNSAVKSSETSFNAMSRGIAGTTASMASLTRQTAMLSDELKGAAAASGAIGVMGGRRAGGRGHGTGIHAHPMSTMGFGFGGPALMAGGSAALLYKGFQSNLTYQQQLSQLELQNLPGGTAEAANAFVMGNQNKMYGPIALARALTDAAVITKNYGEAKGIAPTMARMQALSNAQFGHNVFTEQQQQAAIKAAELLTGSKDVAQLNPALETMFKISTATGFRVKYTDILNMVRGARGALSGTPQYNKAIDLNELYALESLVQESGGPQVGRQIAMLQNHILGGRMTTASAMNMQRHGLVKKGAAEYNKMGMIKRIKPGGIVGSENSNFIDWVWNTYLPSLKTNDWKEIRKNILVDFTNTDANLVTTLIAQQHKIQAMMVANSKAAGFNETEAKISQKPSGQIQQLSAAWERFTTALGGLTSPTIIKGLDTLTNFMNGITKMMNQASAERHAADFKGGWASPAVNKPFIDFHNWFSSNKDGKASNDPHSETPMAASGGSQKHEVHVHVGLDGHQIGKAVTEYQVNGLGRLQYSTSQFTQQVAGNPTPNGTTYSRN